MQRVKTVRLIKPRENGVHSAASRNVWTSGCGWRVSGTACLISNSVLYELHLKFRKDISRSNNNYLNYYICKYFRKNGLLFIHIFLFLELFVFIELRTIFLLFWLSYLLLKCMYYKPTCDKIHIFPYIKKKWLKKRFNHIL